MVILIVLGILFQIASSQSNFVIRQASQLWYNGLPFRYSGANIYWLGLDENVNGIAYPTRFRIEDALNTVAQMGGRVVRSHTLGVSTGNPLSYEPYLGFFNGTALGSADYAIDYAARLGLKLIIPLTDNYRYYTGGKHDFTDWRGFSDENEFYNNPQVISDFKNYISHLLNHVNNFNGIANKDNPTIMAWETGNEIKPPSDWTEDIANFIKSVDGNHLVLDGNYGVNIDSLPYSSVDMYSNHYYPLVPNQVIADAQTVTQAAKVYYIGEYDWTNNQLLPQFLENIETHAVTGDTFWSLFPHLDTYGWEQHNDGYTLHYPTGNNVGAEGSILSIRKHAYFMSNQAVMNYSIPEPPTITLIQKGIIGWRGVVGAAYYSIQTSPSSSGTWTTICNQCTNDNSAPYSSPNITSGAWYRVSASNVAGQQGPFSTPERF